MFSDILGFEISDSAVLALMFSLFYVYYIVLTFVTERVKITVRDLTILGVFTALSVVLSMFKIVDFPQGGGISFVQYLPLMLITLFTNKRNGIIAGFIFGLINIVFGGYILHPLQVIFDYIIPPIAISLIGFKKGGLKETILSAVVMYFFVISSFVLSGVTYFASYTPEATNPLIYSIVYNLSGSGIDLLITVIVLLLLPLDNLKKLVFR